MDNVFVAPTEYSISDANPFTGDGSYDRTWTIFIVDENIRDMMFTGKSPYGCYCISVTPRYKFFMELMADILQYETENGRKVLFVSDGLAHTLIDKVNTYYKSNIIRESDAKLFVHSTLLSTYAKIMRDGMLKSPNRLKSEGYNIHAIGLEPLGEPDDYLDYVMFARAGIAPELVINSRLCGGINCDINAPYIPQARMYFDGHKMIRDGIVVRDIGRKVYDHVPIDKYLLKTVFAADLILPDGNDHWTPLSFSTEADKYMEEYFV